MPKLKCAYCHQKTAQRKCPVVGGYICSFCCGSNRLKEFDCPPDCDYLGNENFYQEAQQGKELRNLLANVPCGQYDDILQDFHYAEIAYAIETNAAAAYVDGMYALTDSKVKEAYHETYRMLKMGETIECQEFSQNLLDLPTGLGQQKKWTRDDMELVLLRLIISVKKMSGGVLGPYSYLNYLRDDVLGKSLTQSKRRETVMNYFSSKSK
jgi:hypothetical protein